MAKYLTAEGLKKIKEELDYLENVKSKEIAERLQHTASFGDLKENSAYDEAKDAQGFLRGRILELKGIIASAELIKENNTGNVEIGSTVLLSGADGSQEFQIVGPEEADILKGRISNESPLGQLLLGKKKGDQAIVKSPGGKTEYKIVEVK